MPGQKRNDVDLTWSGLTLAGTLHLPDRAGPHPAVLMMQGSGPTDRDNDGYFPPIREAFLDRGIAVFSFDKPGIGASTGDWREYALEGRAGQSKAALEILSEHPEIDGRRVGVWGHSQGGWLAQMLASRLRRLSFAISNSGPAIGVEQQDLYGCEHTMRARGYDESEIEQAIAFLDALHAAARSATSYETVDRDLPASARPQPWYGYLTVDDAADWAFLSKVLAERYDPITALSRIPCPFLAVYGGLDLLVPAWESARDSGEALNRAGNTESTIVVFPGGDHRIQDAGTGSLVPGYLDLIADWAAGWVDGR